MGLWLTVLADVADALRNPRNPYHARALETVTTMAGPFHLMAMAAGMDDDVLRERLLAQVNREPKTYLGRSVIAQYWRSP
ncbi:MAG TPA: hypothetical protein PKH03_05025 [Syntrophales bacterium]|nr:hypothetical protein [Syntrophales bacterium]